jgi:hypothetical protein
MEQYKERIQSQSRFLCKMADAVADAEHCRGVQLLELSRMRKAGGSWAEGLLGDENQGDLFGGIGLHALISEHVVRQSRPFGTRGTRGTNDDPGPSYPCCYGTEALERFYAEGVAFSGFRSRS